MSRTLILSIAFVCIAFVGTHVNAQIVGDTVNAVNTFEDGNANSNFTGGAEVFFANGSATVIDPDDEYALFAGIYDINLTDGGMTMTFQNNDGIGIFNYGADTFDRYYFSFDNHFVDSISIDAGGPTELTAGLTVDLIAPGTSVDLADNFGNAANNGFGLPAQFPNGGFLVQFGEGTDYNDGTIGQSVSFSFTTTAVPEPTSGILLCGITGMALIRRRRESI